MQSKEHLRSTAAHTCESILERDHTHDDAIVSILIVS